MRGVVIAEDGRPVEGAEVVGEWRTADASGRATATTDSRGEFLLKQILPGAEVRISARHRALATAEPVVTLADREGPVTVPIVGGFSIALRGRVLGPGGRPVEGAVVRISWAERDDDGRLAHSGLVTTADGAEFRTGPDGTFRTPRELDRRREYRFGATAEGLLPGQTGWVRPTEGDVGTLPDLVLRRPETLRTVAGRVLDREGEPVAGAEVFQSGDGPRRSSDTTDDDGRFLVEDLHEGPAILFARKDGFRFRGLVIGPAEEAPVIVLARDDEPPVGVPVAPPAPMSRAEEREAARSLVTPSFEAAPTDEHGTQRSKALRVLARVDRNRILAMLEDRVLGGHEEVLQELLLGLWEDDPRGARDLVLADRNPGFRAGAYLALFDALPEADRDRHLDLLDLALAEARRLEDPEAKLRRLGQVADRQRALGRIEAATPILREGQRLVEALPEGRAVFAVREFAEVLAAIDLPTALTMIDESIVPTASSEPATLQRHLGGIAWRAAASEPTEAERLLGEIGPFVNGRERFILLACRYMAATDPERARRLIDALHHPERSSSQEHRPLRWYALGLMAEELAESDPDRARALLDEAMAGLRRLAASNAYPPVPAVMAERLPLAERVAPDRVSEYLWLAIASRPPRPEEPDRSALRADATLAALIAPYDRAAADAIAEPVLERLPELAVGEHGLGSDGEELFQALTLYDPRAAVDLIERLPEDRDEVARTGTAFRPPGSRVAVRGKTDARLAVGRMLALPPYLRRREALRYSYSSVLS